VARLLPSTLVLSITPPPRLLPRPALLTERASLRAGPQLAAALVLEGFFLASSGVTGRLFSLCIFISSFP